jgi:nucleoid DNA-binding protein
MNKKNSGVKPPSKSEVLNSIAESTGLTRKDVAKVMDELAKEIEKNIGKRGGPGQFTIPGLCKIVVQHKPALPRRQVRKPGTNEMVWADPKPARKVVKVRALKALKDMVA